MVDVNKLLKMASDFEKMAMYSDRKSFLKRLAQMDASQDVSVVENPNDPKPITYPPPPPATPETYQDKLQKNKNKQQKQLSPDQQSTISQFIKVFTNIKNGTNVTPTAVRDLEILSKRINSEQIAVNEQLVSMIAETYKMLPELKAKTEKAYTS